MSPALDEILSEPDSEEIGRRIDNVRRRMREQRMDAYVVHDPDNVYYLTNFANYVHERPFILVVLPDGPLRFVVPELECSHVQIRSVGELELVPYFEFPAPAGEQWSDRLGDVLGRASRVGVESVCPLFLVESLSAEVVRVDAVDDARMIKSDYEIGRLVHAARIVSDGHAELLSGCRPGELVIALYGSVTRSMVTAMLGEMPNANMLASKFAALVQPPSLSHDPHNFTDTFVALEEGGPHVSVINCRVNGYGAEIERTFFLGTIPESAKAPFEAMMEARRLVFDRLVPGVDSASIDQAVRDHFERKGFGDRMLHRTGHSFGVTGHEAPFIAVGESREVCPGMLFSIEPGIYIEGIGGFRHSDTVLVTDNGNVSLTNAADNLDALILS